MDKSITQSSQKRGIVKQDGFILNIIKGNVFCTSDELAKQFDKRHDKVLEKIDREVALFHSLSMGSEINKYFIKSDRVTSRNKTYRRYDLTFKGFQMIALTYNDKKAFINRVNFINAFETLLKEVAKDKETKEINLNDDLWIQFRNEGKKYRTKLTDTIKEYVIDYRLKVENKMNDGKYYIHYSKLINTVLGIITPKGVDTRDCIDKRTLIRLEDLEDRVADMIIKYSEDMHYKDVYKKIKEELETK